MICQRCGKDIPNERGFCPECGNKLDDIPFVEAQRVDENGHEFRKSDFWRMPSRSSKNYAALLTALLVFPASIITAIDLSFHKYDFWFGYVVGFLFVIWVCAVLPALKLMPPVATGAVCFLSVVGYAFYIMKKSDHLIWLYQRVLPLFILFALLLAVDVALIGSGKLSKFASLALIFFEIGIYIIAIELTAAGSLTNLHWSPILSCGFIIVAAVFLAFAYVFRRKD